MRTHILSSLRGWLLGTWIGLALALGVAFEQGHSPARLLVNAGLAMIPLAFLGALTGMVIGYRPGPGERLRFLLRRLGHTLTDEEVQTLLIEPAATQ